MQRKIFDELKWNNKNDECEILIERSEKKKLSVLCPITWQFTDGDMN